MTGQIIFENALLLDVDAGCLVPDQWVRIENDRIREIGSGIPRPSDARRIDVRGRVLMPGLCDAHVHVTAFSPDVAMLERLPSTYVVAHAAMLLRDMLHRGFTTVRDAGGADHGLARAVAERLIVGPRLLFCGSAISQTGGHGDMRAPAQDAVSQGDCCYAFGNICDGESEVRRACRDAVRKGANHIKLMVSGGVLSPTDRISNDQFADAELLAAGDEARAAGIYCMAHAYTPRSIERAVKAGIRSIEHGNLLDAHAAEVMRSHGTFLVPTLATYDALARQGAALGIPATHLGKLSEVLEAGRAALSLAASFDLPVAFGTDLLGPMQRDQLSEFAIRGEIQAPIDVIRSATSIAAELFMMRGRIGVIASGAFADLLVVDGNPLEDLAVLQDPINNLKVIMRHGEIIRNDLF